MLTEVGLGAAAIFLIFLSGLICCKNDCMTAYLSKNVQVIPPITDASVSKYESYNDSPPVYEDATRIQRQPLTS